MPRSRPEPERRALRLPAWTRLRQAHFHDYSPAALRMWLAIVGPGAIVCGWALWTLAGAGPEVLAQTAAGLLLIAVASWFPIEMPRSKYSMSAADAFIFTALAVLGPAAAILAAGCEGLIGSARTTRRLSSRVSTPAAAMVAMAACAVAFGALASLLRALQLSPAMAGLAALIGVSLVPFAITSLSLMSMMTLKRGAWPGLHAWHAQMGWMAPVYVGGALAAGVVQLVALQHGSMALLIIGVAVLFVIHLLRVSIARNEAAHQAQEARISEAEREAAINQQRFAAAFAEAAIGMAIVEPGGHIVRANKALCALLHVPGAALEGRPFLDVLHPGDVELFQRQARDVAADAGLQAYSIELRCRFSDDGDDGELWVTLHCGRFTDPAGGVHGLIYQLHDITSRQLAERRLQHVAYHDSLTDLANRACFHDKLAAAVEASRVDPTQRFAVMFLDLDRFKVINDSAGHFAGNELLREVGRRLVACLRSDDLVARLGGDEFAVLLRNPVDPGHGVQLAQRIIAELAVPLSIGGNEISPSVSVGITFSDLGWRSVDELLRDADLAMYEAKGAGRGRVAVFDQTMHERIADKLMLEAELRRAIGEGELSLAFQPLFELEPYRLIGFEALARWVHPVRGPVSPAVFIAIAEEAGHIEALTAWALDKAVAQLAAWHRGVPGTSHTGVNVNISGRDLAQPGFVDQVLAVLQRHGVAPGLLTLEITESLLMNNLELARHALGRLRAAGVLLAIDDFGTGYSSLAYLSTLPIDCLKIDRSFVMAMDGGSENIEIVRAVLTLGRALSKKFVAEGIETPEQLAMLRRMGVHVGQGYLLSRPLRPEQVPPLLRSEAVEPAAAVLQGTAALTV